MSKYIRFSCLVMVLTTLVWVIPAHAQQPVVYGVFFYSPTCPHCRDVINNHWGGIQSEFGDQLRVIFIDVTNAQGSQIMQTARTAMHINADGVPMLIIGREVMVGSADIPQHAPVIIRAGLAAGGVDLPPIPGIRDLYALALEQSGEKPPEQTDASQTDTPASAVPSETPSLLQQLQSDPVANAAAILLLVLLVASLFVIVPAYARRLVQHDPRWLGALGGKRGRTILIVLALLGVALAASLVLGWHENVLVLILAGGEAGVFLLLLVLIARNQPLPNWLIPVVAAAGIAVAGYLAYVEITLTKAVCGTVGNCNIVQQSEYARIMNVPIGVIGIAGYISIIIVWLIALRTQRPFLKQALVEMSLLGVAFSAYLTFLEPFVIGASCVWCLTSAVLMLTLLWVLVLLESQPATAQPSTEPLVTRHA